MVCKKKKKEKKFDQMRFFFLLYKSKANIVACRIAKTFTLNYCPTCRTVALTYATDI